jgi:hypothetical protein
VCYAGMIEDLSGSGISAGELCSLRCVRRRRSGTECLPSDLGGFFSGLFEVAVVSPEVRSVFAAIDEDTA